MQRRVFAKLFSLRMLRGNGADKDGSVIPIIHRHATTLHRFLQRYERPDDGGVDTTRDEVAVNLSALLSDFTVEVATEIGFGVTMGFLGTSADGHHNAKQWDDDGNDLHKFMLAIEGVESVMGRRFVLPPWLWKLQRALGWGAEREVLRHLARIDSVAMTLINRSLVANNSDTSTRRKNLVSVFMDEMRVETDSNTSDAGDIKLLRDIAIGFLVVGRDSTTQTLSWVFYCIAPTRTSRRDLWRS